MKPAKFCDCGGTLLRPGTDLKPELSAEIRLIRQRLPRAKVAVQVCGKCGLVHLHVKA
jgi:hypothetical protein